MPISWNEIRHNAIKFSREWAPQLPILACEMIAQILDAGDFETTLLAYLDKAHS